MLARVRIMLQNTEVNATSLLQICIVVVIALSFYNAQSTLYVRKLQAHASQPLHRHLMFDKKSRVIS